MIGATFTIMGDDAIVPRRAHIGDAGLDLAIQTDITVKPHDTIYAPAGIALNIPSGYAAHVITRSSTFKYNVIVVPTVVDQDYHDEISIIITNNNDAEINLKRGTYLAQVILMHYQVFDNEIASSVVRGSDKFGSSDR